MTNPEENADVVVTLGGTVTVVPEMMGDPKMYVLTVRHAPRGQSTRTRANVEQLTKLRDRLSLIVWDPKADENFVASRHARMLTKKQVDFLVDHPYAQPRGVASGAEMKRARELAEMGLVEKDPSAGRAIYRCTAAGEEVVMSLRQKGWIPWPST